MTIGKQQSEFSSCWVLCRCVFIQLDYLAALTWWPLFYNEEEKFHSAGIRGWPGYDWVKDIFLQLCCTIVILITACLRNNRSNVQTLRCTVPGYSVKAELIKIQSHLTISRYRYIFLKLCMMSRSRNGLACVFHLVTTLSVSSCLIPIKIPVTLCAEGYCSPFNNELQFDYSNQGHLTKFCANW